MSSPINGQPAEKPNGPGVGRWNDKSPPWDGLADEAGPIPTFGPVTTDETGRIVMSDEEWEARGAATIRALAAIMQITDETDTDELWDEMMRASEGGL